MASKNATFVAPLPVPSSGVSACSIALCTSAPARKTRPLRRTPVCTADAQQPDSAPQSAVTPQKTTPGQHAHQYQDRRHMAQESVVVRAPLVDSRVSSVVEAHHWITVSSASVRMFERAAVAQADMVRRVERNTATGAQHRWVLRPVDVDATDPSSIATLFSQPASIVAPQSVNQQSRYVVMETFKHGEDTNSGVMRRWLGAIEHVGPAFDASNVQTLRYENVYTAKLHEAKFDVNTAVVVVETINADGEEKAREVEKCLRSTADVAVASGDCLEYCVLEAMCKPGLFKTIEVYKDASAFGAYMNELDSAFLHRLRPHTVQGSHRSRSAFKPVVFS